jgi:ADP-heptose:LPS heptosyltransferase
VEVISLLKKSHPDYTFNIIHKPDSNIDGFKTEDIQNALNEGGVLGDCHLVSGNLTEMAVLMEKQKLVLSNDTGLAHIAGALKNGPPVLTLFSPRGAPEPKFWISNQKKQRAVTLPPSAVLDFPDGYDVYRGDQTDRPINRIPPQTVANVALEKLKAA